MVALGHAVCPLQKREVWCAMSVDAALREAADYLIWQGSRGDDASYPEAAERILSLLGDEPKISPVPTITPTRTRVYSSGDASVWDGLRNAKPGDAILMEAGGVFPADPHNMRGVKGTRDNPVFFGGDSSSRRSRIECAAGDRWKEYRARWPGNQIARAWWWEDCHHIEGMNFNTRYSAYWAMMIGGADNGGATSGRACSHIHLHDFQCDHWSRAAIKWLNGSSSGHLHDFRLTGGESHKGPGGEGIYEGSGGYPQSYGLSLLVEDFEIDNTNGEAIDRKRLSRGASVYRRGHIHDLDLYSQGAVTNLINEHKYPPGEPEPVLFEDLLIERIRSRRSNGQGFTLGGPAKIVRCTVRDTVDDCIGIYGQFNMDHPVVEISDCTLMPPKGKKAIDERDQKHAGKWPQIKRSGNRVPAAEVQAGERAL